jgi:hypothetical protein
MKKHIALWAFPILLLCSCEKDKLANVNTRPDEYSSLPYSPIAEGNFSFKRDDGVTYAGAFTGESINAFQAYSEDLFSVDVVGYESGQYEVHVHLEGFYALCGKQKFKASSSDEHHVWVVFNELSHSDEYISYSLGEAYVEKVDNGWQVYIADLPLDGDFLPSGKISTHLFINSD